MKALINGAGWTPLAVLVLACGGAPQSAEGPVASESATADAADVDRSGFPLDVLVRPELQRLVDAGLDRRTAPLLDALADTDPVVRRTAAYALASVQDPTARSRLVALLADTDAAVRTNAAFALGQIGNAGDAPALIAALRDEDDALVRLTILEAAGKTGSAADLAQILRLGLDATGDDGAGLALALYHFARSGITDPRGAPTLLSLLHSADARARVTAALALAAPRNRTGWGVTARDVRAELDVMPAGRRAAGPLLRILASFGDESDIPVLTRRLADTAHWTVRVAAAASLGDHRAAGASASAVDALLRALDDSSSHVAVAAARSLVALRERTQRSTDAIGGPEGDGAYAGVLADWIRAHPGRPTVAAALLPALVASPHESLIIEWATGALTSHGPRSLAWPALALTGTTAADSILMAGLLGTRRDAYAAAAALAERLSDQPENAALRSSLLPLLPTRLAIWGPHAPGSDVRGAVRLTQELTEGAPVDARELLAAAARHPHADIRATASPPGAPGATVPDMRRREVGWSLLESVGARPCLVFTTTRGSFIVELHPEAAPLSVSALIEWSAAGAYDGLTFHRVEPDFILQSGDFDNEHGYGGPEHGLRSEISQLRFAPGVLGMASSGRDTEGSQFFITHNYAPSLDGRYSAVGHVIAGQSVADDVALGDALVTVSPFGRHADETPDERSARCTSEPA